VGGSRETPAGHKQQQQQPEFRPFLVGPEVSLRFY
jgi:hypothetical protein